MRKFSSLFLITVSVLFLSSCATICGGSRYYAKVQVPNHPDARIEYKGEYMGSGEVSFAVPRREADVFSVTIKEEGNPDYYKRYYMREFRGWAFFGTVIGWTGVTPTGIPLPWGMVVDGACGSWWKPDIREPGVIKNDYKHFTYKIDYPYDSEKTTAIKKEDDISVSDVPMELRKLKGLLEDGVITQEEYDAAKNKLLEQY